MILEREFERARGVTSATEQGASPEEEEEREEGNEREREREEMVKRGG